MKSSEILQKYLDFYGKREHKLIANVSLVPQNDPTLLFVNSGVFPLVPYVFGEQHPLGKRLMNVQRCVRFEDIEDVGESNRHTIAFHMIGNWSLGDYFKKEQLPWIWEFFVEILGLDINKLYGTVFKGDTDAPRDEESIELLKEIYKKYGIQAKENEQIFAYSKEEGNWWKRGDTIGEPGGPSSEIFYYIGKDGTGLGKNPIENDSEFIEIGNSVFMQYKKKEGGWEELAQKNVDFGGGLERIALAVQGKQDIFETDNFWPLIEKIQELSNKKYHESHEITVAMRTLADHVRTACLMAMDEVTPSNKDQGYMLRRILRRMVRVGKKLGIERDISVNLVDTTANLFDWIYPQLKEKAEHIKLSFSQEEEKFRKVLGTGTKLAQKELGKLATESDLIPLVEVAFDLYQSVGFPHEIFVDEAKDQGFDFKEREFYASYQKKLTQHKEQSRTGAEQKFTGGLAEHSEQIIKFHTATHLLHWALREILGTDVHQQGSNITNERLRFDVSFNRTLTEEEIVKVATLVNEKILSGLPVSFVILPKEEALKSGAMHLFNEKYGDNVKIYFIGANLQAAFSKEFCGGPHVTNTKEIGTISIFKQKKIGENLLRLYAKNS